MERSGGFRIEAQEKGCRIALFGDFDFLALQKFEKRSNALGLDERTVIDCKNVDRLDTIAALFLVELQHKHSLTLANTEKIERTLELARKYPIKELPSKDEGGFIAKIGKEASKKFCFVVAFLNFIGELFVKKVSVFFKPKYFRYKEILFEINQSAIKALGIVALTSFLVGVVIAYQSAVQLKLYGANIFIVDMLGISILRELAPMITAIVIAGRSGSAYTAEIGAMKITEELDAMRTMGFDPFYYLVIPRIVALVVTLPILIFVADISGVLGGMLISNTQLNISFGLFIDRFNEVIALKHFLIGIFKGPFFAFLIATIAIYRGFMVKDDTQSIGKNTTKSVVESIFAVIVCDALFSVIFTNLGV